MNKIVLVLLASAMSLFALEFHNYKDALKMQKKSGKVIMIDVVRSDCHYCHKMDAQVFNDAQMSKWIEQKFIPVKLDLDFDDLPLGIKVHFTPTFFFVNKEQKIIKTIPGSWNIQDFKDLTKNIK